MTAVAVIRQPIMGEVLRFGVVGGLAFVLDAAVLWLTMHFGASPYGGRLVSIPIAMLAAWWLNRRVTFRTAAPPGWREFRAYILQALLGVVVSYAVYAAALKLGTGTPVALVLGTGIASVFNFVRYRKILKPGLVR